MEQLDAPLRTVKSRHRQQRGRPPGQFLAPDTVDQARTGHVATEHDIGNHQIIVFAQKSRPCLVRRGKGIDIGAPLAQLPGERQALLDRILDIQDSATQGLLGVEEMAGESHQLVEILLAENFGNPGPLGLCGQLGARAAGQQDDGRHRNEAIATQAPAQRQTVAVMQLPGNNHEIEGFPGGFEHSLGR